MHRIALTIWVLILTGGLLTSLLGWISPWDVLLSWWSLLEASPLWLFGLYLLRPFFFFPSTPLLLASGILMTWPGSILLSLVGELFSASFAYLLFRHLGLGTDRQRINQLLAILRRHGGIGVISMRLAYIHLDLVSSLAGMAKVRPVDFYLGSALGLLPGILFFTALGQSLPSITTPFDLPIHVLGFGVLGAGLLIAGRMVLFSQKQPTGPLEGTGGKDCDASPDTAGSAPDTV